MTVEEIINFTIDGGVPLKKRWVEFLLSNLKKDEKIKLSFVGKKTTENEKLEVWGKGYGLVFITDLRIIYGWNNDSWLSKYETFKDLIITENTNIEGGGSSIGWVKISNTNGEFIFGDIREVGKIIDVISDVINSKQNNNTTNDDVFGKIEKLKKLFDDGVLTKDEFNIKKSELLKSI